MYIITCVFTNKVLRYFYCHRVPTIMKNLENSEILNHPEKSLKSHGFLSFFKKSWRVIVQGKSHGILHKPSVPSMIYGYGSLLVCIYKFTTLFHALSCMYYSVSVVVAVRGGHLHFSKKFKFIVRLTYFRKCTFDVVDLTLDYPTLVENTHEKS